MWAKVWLPRIRTLVQQPWLVRVIHKQPTSWENAAIDVETASGVVFSKSEEDDVSVYKVWNEMEETRAIAAHQISRKQLPSSSVFALRIRYKELRKAKIRVESSEGNTGIHVVDYFHRDLFADEAQYRSLGRFILEAHLAGEVRVRRAPSNVVVSQFPTFSSLKTNEIAERARKECRRLMDMAEKRRKK